MKNKNLNAMALSDETLLWLNENLEKGKVILEFGSGTGTIELTKNWKVYSVEQNIQWIGVAENSTYIHAPLKDGWYDKDIVFNSIPDKYDLIIIDGPAGTDFRSGIDKYWDRFNTNVPLIFDDTQRTPDRNHAIHVANLLNKEWIEVKGWEKNFIIVSDSFE